MPPSYFSRLKSVFQHKVCRSISSKYLGLQGSFEVLTGQGILGNYRLFCSTPYTSGADPQVLVRSVSVFAARSDSQLVNHRGNSSFAGVISRALSVPSVSGPSFQVCGYHTDRLFSYPSDSSFGPIGCNVQEKPMAASGSKAVCPKSSIDTTHFRSRSLVAPLKNICGYTMSRRVDCCVKVSLCSRKGEDRNNNLVNGDLMHDFTKRIFNSKLHQQSGVRSFHSLSSACFSAGMTPDVSFDNSLREEMLASSDVRVDQKVQADRTMKLLSGSCYLPHPDKEETGGEDAHFICVDEQAIGVADGVGGWADLGIDAGMYARELMSNSVSAVYEEPKGSIDPARVLEKAHSSTKSKGSSTACIIALTGQGLNAINLGDSGFMVVRDGCTVFRSPVQQYDFNFPYQLESGNNGDTPSSGQVFTIPVASGDVIIAGTDGLFDNLYNNEVTAVVVHAVRAGFGPQVAAQKIAALARERAQDKNRQTPFSTAAQDAGILYYGGKLDDITVVVSYIKSSVNENNSWA